MQGLAHLQVAGASVVNAGCQHLLSIEVSAMIACAVTALAPMLTYDLGGKHGCSSLGHHIAAVPVSVVC